MRTIETKVYQYDELSDKAKDKVRDWYLGADWEFDGAEYVIEDAVTVGALMGIEVHTHSVPLMNGKSRQEPTVYYSGFSSQGDGACFEGSYQYKKGAVKAVKAYAPEDKELHRIAQELQTLQKSSFYSLTAETRHSGHYYHSGCMAVDVEDSREIDVPEGSVNDLADIMRDFANWIYKQLEAEYDYQTSDEQVAETIRANEYEFTAEGGRV